MERNSIFQSNLDPYHRLIFPGSVFGIFLRIFERTFYNCPPFWFSISFHRNNHRNVHNAKCVSIYRNVKRCVSLLAMLLRFNAHTHSYHGNTFETATRFRNLNRMKFDSRSDSILFHWNTNNLRWITVFIRLENILIFYFHPFDQEFKNL